jgi:tetratricopeptide (TPR) repeat protein
VYFQNKQYKEALNEYEQAAALAITVPSLESTWINCKLNITQCAINLGDFSTALTASTEVLKKDGKNLKGLYRRAVTRNHLGFAEEEVDAILL